jgi:hypothetical protein
MPVTMALSTLVNTCNASPGLRTMWSAPSSGTGKTGKALARSVSHHQPSRYDPATSGNRQHPFISRHLYGAMYRFDSRCRSCRKCLKL